MKDSQIHRTTFLPVGLRLDGVPVAVFGGGTVGERRVRCLLACGAHVKLFSPDSTAGLAALADAGEIEWFARLGRESDLRGMALAVIATNDTVANEALAVAARSQGVLVNRADDAGGSDLVFPAILDLDGLRIAIHTDGRAPSFAAAVRRRLELELGSEIGELLAFFEEIRKRVMASALDVDRRGALLRRMAESDLPDVLKKAGWDAALAAASAMLSEEMARAQ
ncbi:MAG: bifunctional precorrin-2 dehydrogenase/sirohydrochlorin ferrochelatase [Candidatus Sumerlaeaceae bacterium]|nr:bifunctional precorrin-2 dehydrogenase/sirohydrochlorin ferrochelatase [Candidatus Sumerlaeaceae bacterium]